VILAVQSRATVSLSLVLVVLTRLKPAGGVFVLCPGMSWMYAQESCVTILAAIGSQAKKSKNGLLQQTLDVGRLHIRAATLRAKPPSALTPLFWARY
jgi:hypothetical protein